MGVAVLISRNMKLFPKIPVCISTGSSPTPSYTDGHRSSWDPRERDRIADSTGTGSDCPGVQRSESVLAKAPPATYQKLRSEDQSWAIRAFESLAALRFSPNPSSHIGHHSLNATWPLPPLPYLQPPKINVFLEFVG